MRPLFDQAFYERLRTERELMSAEGRGPLAPVFVPVGPDTGSTPPLRVLFIGQAAYASTEAEAAGAAALDFEASAARSADNAARLLRERRSPYWQAIRAILDQVLRTIGGDEWADPGRLTEIAGFSNLAKIGLAGSGHANPGDADVRAQAALCAECLPVEVRAARPTAVVLMSGGESPISERILLTAFGRDGWRNNAPGQDRVALKRFGACDTTLLWMEHLRTVRANGTEREVVAFVAGYIAALAERRA